MILPFEGYYMLTSVLLFVVVSPEFRQPTSQSDGGYQWYREQRGFQLGQRTGPVHRAVPGLSQYAILQHGNK